MDEGGCGSTAAISLSLSHRREGAEEVVLGLHFERHWPEVPQEQRLHASERGFTLQEPAPPVLIERVRAPDMSSGRYQNRWSSSTFLPSPFRGKVLITHLERDRPEVPQEQRLPPPTPVRGK